MHIIEQIIKSLQALNATNNTSAYASKFVNSSFTYTSEIANNGSLPLACIPAATVLAGVIILIVYNYRASREDNSDARRILERKQTGFFRPKRSNTCAAQSQTEKLSAAECLQIMEVLAIASDEVTTLDKKNEDQYRDEQFSEDVAETILKAHLGEAIDFSSSSSSDLSVDSAEEVDDAEEDNESTPTNRSRDTDYSGGQKPSLYVKDETPVAKQEPQQFNHEPQHCFVDESDAQGEAEDQPGHGAGNEEEQSADEAERQFELEQESIMSDDEEYTKPMNRPGSSGSLATVNLAHDAPRRSSWHGEVSDSKAFQIDQAKFDDELKANSSQPVENSGEHGIGDSTLPPRRGTIKAPSQNTTKAPTFEPDGVIPPRRASTKKSDVSATDPESSKAPSFTHGMMQAMAQYAAHNNVEGDSSGYGFRRPYVYRRYKGKRRI